MSQLKIEKTVKCDNGEAPKPGQKVEVHYTGKLENGKVFDCSRTKGRKFQFNLGMGEVIRGWDEGVLQMRVGERANLICPPEYGYGAKGIPGVIPQNATLHFDVEFLRIVK